MEYRYDGSYEGLLSCIFCAYQHKTLPIAINAEPDSQPALFDATELIETNEEWAARVLRGIDSRTNGRASHLLYNIFLSELPQREILCFHLVRAITQKGDESILENFANPHVLQAAKIEKMMHREVHRMHAFVRFQKTRTGLFYAAIDPDFNVLPLIGDHFERRYADQPWLILDTRRHYALHYDRVQTSFITLDNPIFTEVGNALQGSIHNDEHLDFQDEKEQQYQELWKNYFHAVNISERNNKKLHLRHVPRRYWKYLTEKSL
ncbi:MAG TPA: TIGR03915 family putative DNA repair protein [Cellvibrio sp.]|nr:TIGR03915 family putative DNA repair protein [Cellvibrio sp.]